jgi:hypothetical protein
MSLNAAEFIPFPSELIAVAHSLPDSYILEKQTAVHSWAK